MLAATSVDFDLEDAGVFGGRTGDFGSGFGIPSGPCVEDLSAIPGREDPVVVDRDPILVCICGRLVEVEGKVGLAFLTGPSSPKTKGLFLGIL